jgi:hypothetical protein
MRRVLSSLVGLVLGAAVLPGCGEKKDDATVPTVKARELPPQNVKGKAKAR